MKKIRVVSIVGTRPEFVKIAAISPLLSKNFYHSILNTGQHYNTEMANIFFEQLKIQKPEWNLRIGQQDATTQIAQIMIGCKNILLGNRPDAVLIYGDTNTTLAGALSSVKTNIPIAHIEAGMRSFDKTMPEEVNRIICDHISTWHFCSSQFAVICLQKEGLTKNVYETGDVNYDIFLKTTPDKNVTKRFKIQSKKYFLATIHRQENTDNLGRFKKIVSILEKLPLPIIIPIHPRTEKILKKTGIKLKNVKTIKPQGFVGMLGLLKNAEKVLTDSGGVQKEAYWLRVPCITLRSSTEWPETVNSGWNHLTDLDRNLIFKLAKNEQLPRNHLQLYGNGHASEKIVKILKKQLA